MHGVAVPGCFETEWATHVLIDSLADTRALGDRATRPAASAVPYQGEMKER